MRIDARLNRLELEAAKLPPNGAALIREMQRLTPNQQEEWLKGLTDAELETIIETDGVDHINWDQVTDEELERMVEGTFDFDNMRPELIRR